MNCSGYSQSRKKLGVIFLLRSEFIKHFLHDFQSLKWCLRHNKIFFFAIKAKICHMVLTFKSNLSCIKLEFPQIYNIFRTMRKQNYNKNCCQLKLLLLLLRHSVISDSLGPMDSSGPCGFPGRILEYEYISFSESFRPRIKFASCTADRFCTEHKRSPNKGVYTCTKMSKLHELPNTTHHLRFSYLLKNFSIFVLKGNLAKNVPLITLY